MEHSDSSDGTSIASSPQTPDDIQSSTEPTDTGWSLTVDMTEVTSLALHQNRISVVDSVTISSPLRTVTPSLKLCIETEPEKTNSRVIELDPLEGGGGVISPLEVHLSSEAAWSQTSSERVDLVVTLSSHGRELARTTRSLEVLAPDQWSGATTYPESIASFITPNASEIVEFRQNVAKELRQLRPQDPSLDGYQSNSPEKVAALIQSAWRALARLRFTYAQGAHDHRKRGQTVMTPADLLKGKTGNCVDLTLLFCSVLESIGLHPIVILTQTHCFAAVWQAESTFSDIVHDDPTRLVNRINQASIIAIECTLLCESASFQQALGSGATKVRNLSSADCTIIDISACRAYGLTPLSSPRQELSTDAGSQQQDQLQPAEPWAPQIIDPASGQESSAGRLQRWLTKLLDITLRNRLLNHRDLKNVISLTTSHIDQLEDALSHAGRYVTIKPRPEALEGNTLLDDSAEPPFDHRAAMSSLTSGGLQQHAKKLASDAKSILSETGTNAAYLALGMLNFTVEDNSYRAPIILIPVEVDPKFAGKSVRFKRSPEDPSINHCLIEYLKSKHGIDIPGLGEDLPLDDEGVDVPGILAHVEKFITEANRPGWHITRASALGIFQFRKWEIWNDIRSNPELVEKSPLCQMLLQRDATTLNQNISNRTFPLRDLACPLPFDSTQEAAISASANGESFVLVGPPGTGKSQTITNILSKAIHDGRRVLFVAEKAVALAVVERHLETVGLSDWCLNLHSDHANRTSFLSSIQDGLAAARRHKGRSRDGRLTTFAQNAESLMQSSEELRTDLHQSKTAMPSIWHVADEQARLPTLESSQPPDISPDITQPSWDINSQQRTYYENAAKSVSPVSDHPLCDLDSIHGDIHEIVDSIKTAAESARKLRTQLSSLDDMAHNFDFKTITLQNLSDIATVDRARQAAGIPPALTHKLLSQKWSTLGQKFIGECKVLIKFADLKSRIDRKFSQSSASSLPLDELLKGLKRSRVAWAPLRWLATHRHRKQLAEYYRTDVPRELNALILDLETWIEFENAKPGAQRAFKNLRKLFSDVDPKLNRDQLTRIEQSLLLLEQAAEAQHRLQSTDTELASSTLHHDEIGGATRWANDMDSLATAIKLLQPLSTKIRLDQLSLPELWHKIETWHNSMDRTKEWCSWREAAAQLRQTELGWAIYAIENDEVTPDLWLDASRGGLMRSWLQNCARKLRSSFTDQQQKDLCENLEKTRDKTGSDTSIAVSKRYWSASEDVSNSRARSQTAPLENQTRVNRSIRRVLQDCGPLLRTLKPCVLASPLAVAKHLANDADNRFDLVVFDEASQIPPWDALAALMRSKACIVVGDPKQLPPTRFFSGTTDDADETAVSSEDDGDFVDLESLLHEGLAANLPNRHLLWHYRSADESLIALSNRLYYANNPMHTLPANPMPHLNYGVHFRHVPHGLYERGGRKVNEREAEFIVGEIIRRLKQTKSQSASHSILVVSFNKPQQVLIDNLLEAALANDLQARAAYEEQAKTSEPIDIKNLENVQGDERDIVLLSVCYGRYDPDKPPSMNFGPLNQAGGERRLNVAITRARQELLVVSSIKADDLDLSRTSQRGPRDFHRFLSYAEHGPSSLPINRVKTTDLHDVNQADGVELQIASALETQGWIVESRYGQSEDWRIGLVIKRPDEASWRLGIETDGQMWSRYEVVDRDAVRPTVLSHKMGWTIHRVALRDWLVNPDQVVKDIIIQAESVEFPEPPEATDQQTIEINIEALIPSPDNDHARKVIAPATTTPTSSANKGHLSGYALDVIIDLAAKGHSASEISERMQQPTSQIEPALAELQAAGLI